MTRRWQCTVCGYIHVGEAPPDVCPVCGADRTKFIALETEAAVADPGLWATFKLHPVAAHFPAGLLPTAAFFLLLGVATGAAAFEVTAFWLVLVATAVVPVSIASGLYEWQRRFGGRRAAIFVKKIALALTLLCLGVAATALRFGAPGGGLTDGWAQWGAVGALLGMLPCVVLLGHYGAILARRDAGVPRLAQAGAVGDLVDAWLKVTVAHAPEAILVADATGTIRFWNQGAERIFGVPAARAVGQSLNLIIPDNLRERHWQGWGQVMQTGQSHYGASELLQVPAIRGDGSRFSAAFSLVMIKNERGEIAAVAAILRDVSAQREREKNLQAQLDACRHQATGL